MHHIVSIGSLPVVIPSYHLYGEYEAISQSFYISNFVRAYVCRVEPACKAEPKIVFCARCVRLTGLTVRVFLLYMSFAVSIIYICDRALLRADLYERVDRYVGLLVADSDELAHVESCDVLR